MPRASVVLPTCRGPSDSNAGWASRRCRTCGSMARVISVIPGILTPGVRFPAMMQADFRPPARCLVRVAAQKSRRLQALAVERLGGEGRDIDAVEAAHVDGEH